MKNTRSLRCCHAHGQPHTAAAALCLALWLGTPAWASDSIEPTREEEKFIATECSPVLGPAYARRAMQLVRAQLLAQGMKLVVQACPFVRVGGQMRQVVDVRVVVQNSDVATRFVRGPLADDEAVDMGDVYMDAPDWALGLQPVKSAGAADEGEEGDDVSPDVLFNRQWLAGLMQHRGLQAVPGHWWAFEPVPSHH